MYTYLTCITPDIHVNIDGELKAITAGEPFKGLITLNTANKDITVNQLVLSVMGARHKGRDLKLDRFNVKHQVEIAAGSTVKFPFRMMIDKKKYASNMRVDIHLSIKTSAGDFESTGTLRNIITEETL